MKHLNTALGCVHKESRFTRAGNQRRQAPEIKQWKQMYVFIKKASSSRLEQTRAENLLQPAFRNVLFILVAQHALLVTIFSYGKGD